MVSFLAAVTLMPAAHLISITPDLSFGGVGSATSRTFGPFDATIPFNEAIVSWNVGHSEVAALKVEARAIIDGRPTSWYVLGDWAGDAKLHPRESVARQSDADGKVMTDTLHLQKPAQAIELNVTGQTLEPGPAPDLKLLTVSVSNIDQEGSDGAVRSTAWGKIVDVPERAQGNYPNGGVLCSPTSVSMVLWHYANQLSRPDLNHDVPDVEAGVWDSVFKGAGNWPFNTAYAGSFPGMRAYVARFNAISDLERWIDAGLPVVCSVSFDMLRGKPLSADESGHLVVLVGFTNNGDPVFNDPAHRDEVRKTYKRSDFERAWIYGHRTVYLIYPENAAVPSDPDGLWIP
jgi:hypothetical protein